MTEALHNTLCTECMTLKHTGLTMNQYNIWKTKIGYRSELERSFRSMGVDVGLVTDDRCFDCSLEDYVGSDKGVDVFELVGEHG